MEQVLHELPEGWEWSSIGGTGKVTTGNTPPKAKKEYYANKSGYLFVKPPQLGFSEPIVDTPEKLTEAGFMKSKPVEKGSILVCCIGSIGKVGIAGTNLATNQQINSITFDNRVDFKWGYYFALTLESTMKSMANSAVVSIINKSTFSKIRIPLPPLNEQKRIVDKLGAFFTRIDTAITHLQQTLELSKALFASALDEAFRDSTLPKVVLTDVVDFIGGSQPPKSQFSEVPHDGYVRLIQIRDYKTDAHKVYVKKESTKKLCAVDDVMIGRYGPPVFQILRGLEGAYNVALMKAIPNEECLSKRYLFWFLLSPSIQNYIVGLSQRAAGQSGVNKRALEKYEISLPSLNEQKRIVTQLDALSERTRALEATTQEKLNDLTTLKASLLDAAFKGQL